MFCDIVIDSARPLTNYMLLGDIALEFAGKLMIQESQNVLAEMWKPYMKDFDTMYTNATCYESEIRYPTDQKLLWECVEKGHALMCRASRKLGIHRPRTMFLVVEKANLTYRKQLKHSKSQTGKITRCLLNLLGKILKEMRKMEREHNTEAPLFTERESQTMADITTVYRRQHCHFRSGDIRESIPNRIVSVNKPYVRPILRGKEAKDVEFGVKCNSILVDGISFTEKLSFNAFNEGDKASSLHQDALATGRNGREGDRPQRQLSGQHQPRVVYIEWYPYLVRPEGQTGQGEAGEGLCARGPCKSEGYDDGRIIRDSEGAPLDA